MLSIMLLLTGHGLHDLQLQAPNISELHMHISPVIIELLQCVAYIGAGVTGGVSGHGWMIKQKWYVKYTQKKIETKKKK